MFSLRRDQFRAILLSLLITDALCHQQIPWFKASSVGINQGSGIYRRMNTYQTLERDRWSHTLTHILRYLVDTPSVTPGFFTQPYQMLERACYEMEHVAEVILIALPLFLQLLDHTSMNTNWVTQTHPHWRQALSTYYETVLASLATNTSAQPSRLSKASTDRSGTIDTLVTLAIQHNQQANSNFPLTVGLSYHFADKHPGLPILSGLLSACRVGSKGIPTAWLQALQKPRPDCRQWLERRWQISSATIVDTWANVLFQHWAGKHQAFTHGDTYLIPAAIGPSR